jgi:hypothetical protein
VSNINGLELGDGCKDLQEALAVNRGTSMRCDVVAKKLRPVSREVPLSDFGPRCRKPAASGAVTGIWFPEMSREVGNLCKW